MTPTTGGGVSAGTASTAHACEQPWQVVPVDREWLSPNRQRQLVWAFLILAIVARSVRFLLRFPLWEDECFLAANFIDRGYLDLLRPLSFHQVAPLLFLWVELTSVKLFGFNEWSLRLFSFVCSSGGLFVFRHLAARLLKGTALVVAIAVFCVSYSGIRYAAEGKPYGPDGFVSLVLLTLAVEWWTTGRQRWLWCLTGCVPLAVGLSYPAVFTGGALSLLVAAAPLSKREHRGWTAWAAYNAALLAGFGVVLSLAARNQAAAELGWMQDYWKDQLPSLARPVAFIGWFFETHASDLLAIPLGGSRGASTLTFLGCLAGLAAMIRARRFLLALFCVAPSALNLAAATMGRYPYGGHVKFSQYIAPLICLALGVGVAALLVWYDRRTSRGRRALSALLVVYALIAVGTMARDFACPYKSPTDRRYRDFARWFWFNLEFGGEVACLKTDLHQEFAPGTFHELGWSAMYLCNQRIYSPRHARGEPLRLDRVCDAWPLRCVQFKAEVYKYDEAAFQRWLADMRRRYELVSRDTYPFPCYDQRGNNLLCVDYVDVLKFIPKPDVARPPSPPGNALQR